MFEYIILFQLRASLIKRKTSLQRIVTDCNEFNDQYMFKNLAFQTQSLLCYFNVFEQYSLDPGKTHLIQRTREHT